MKGGKGYVISNGTYTKIKWRRDGQKLILYKEKKTKVPKTEEEIAAHLGDPSELAADYKDGMTLPGILAKKIEKVNKPKPQEPTAQTVSFVILITVLLAIPAFFVLFGLVLIMLLLEIGAIAGAISLLASCWFYGAFLASGLFAGLTLLFLAIFGFALCYFSVKYFVFGTKWYIKSMQHVWHNGI